MIAGIFRRVFSIASLGPVFFLASLLVPIGVALYLIVFAKPPVPSTSAVLSTVNNVVEVQAVDDSGGFRPAQEEQVLVAGDDVRTAEQGRGVITFIDESSLVLEPDSQLTILPPQRSGGGLINRINQSFGSSFSQFSSLASGGGRYEIQTPAGVVSVRDGAILRVGVGRSSTGKDTVQVVVLQGEAEVKAPEGSGGGSTVVGAGQSVTATEGEAVPQAQAFVPDNDVVLRLFSPFWMLVAEPNTGLVTGLIPVDKSVLQIPLSVTTAGGVSPQTVRLNDVVPGTYTIYLLPKKDGGDFRVTADGRALEKAIFADSRSGTTSGCEWYYLTLNVDLDKDGLLNFGELQGPFPLTSVPFLFSQKIESPCPPPSPLQAQVQGEQATPVPTAAPTQQPTPVPLPTEIPPEQPPPPPPEPPAPTAVPPRPTPGRDIDISVQTPEPPEPSPAPSTPAPPPPPDIGIGHCEPGPCTVNNSAASLPLLPLLLAASPALLGGVAGALKKRVSRR